MSDQKEKKEHLKFLSLLPITLEALMELDKEPHDDSIVHHLYDHISKYSKLIKFLQICDHYMDNV